ncbi:MAG: hydantoinase/oxoprolinase family protein [Alphaproteobacteria bacterium]
MPTLLGIDTGGTYTDAALFDTDKGVIRSAKSLTTKHDLAIGVRGAVDGVLEDDHPDVRLVSLSTTLATNAIVEGQGSPVCLLMIGHGPEALDRADLRKALDGDPVAFIDGGHSPSGDEQMELDLDAARAAIEAHADNVDAFAVAGYFAVRNPAHEQAVRDLVFELTGKPVSCGHDLSWRLDAPRRALTAVLNARLIPVIQQLIHAVHGIMAEKAIKAPLMVVKGDGSLVSEDTALARPVETILSGPAASVVGAHHLSGENDVFVVDMGGTTTDIALLKGGRPVLNVEGATVGGWRTMVEAVAAHTVGLGGDSEVWFDAGPALAIGPQRVVPISLLAHEHPGIIERLHAQAAREPAHDNDGRFALRLRNLDGGRANLTATETRLWEAMTDGPVALEKLFAGDHPERSLKRLVRRGLVVTAGFTPSDACHVLGHHKSWSVEAAGLAATLWARRAAAYGIAPDGDIEAFAAQVMEGVVARSAEAIIATALAEGDHVKTIAGDGLGRHFLAQALAPKHDDDGGFLDIALTLRRPLVAIGAPAATYYPAVAERLNTRLVVPTHAEVSNAVGAVAGGVTQTVKTLITTPDEMRYRMHAPSGVQEFANLEQAAEAAEQEARTLAEAHARDAGAVEVRVEVERNDTIAKGKDGSQVFIESEIIATALGRPRLGEADA